MSFTDLLKTIFLNPLLNLLLLFYFIFERIGLPWPLGWSIILLTYGFKKVTEPFFKKQLEQAKKMQELAPQIKKLEKKYKNDRLRLQEEQMKLYQKAGINPASGCLVFLIQAPFLYALYTAFLTLLKVNSENGEVLRQINSALYFNFLKITRIDPNFLFYNLTISPSEAVKQFGFASAWHYYLIPVITGFLQYYLTTVSMPQASKQEEEKQPQKKGKKEEDFGEEFGKAMQTQMKFVFPVLIAWFSFSFPVGLALYWNLFSLLSILQARKLSK